MLNPQSVTLPVAESKALSGICRKPLLNRTLTECLQTSEGDCFN